MLDIVMHNVIIFVLVNPPLSACERRSCSSRLSDWLHTGSIQRTINVWNNLSTDCVQASSVNMFKNKIDKYLVKAGYT